MDRVILNDLDFENRNEALYFLKKLWKFIKALFLKDTLKTLNICNKRRFGISLSSGENIGRPFDDNWGIEDPTGKSDEKFKIVIEQIRNDILELRSKLDKE